MPGHNVTRSDVKNTALFDKYQCPHCSRLLKNAVQPLCGHWLCESCADDLLESETPVCPRLDCQEDLKEEGAEYFPDRFVRREIEGMIVCCTYRQKGCKWEGKLGKFEDHLMSCKFTSSNCPQCGEILTLDQIESHKETCPKAEVTCPLAELGCPHKRPMTRQELEKHVYEKPVKHLEIISTNLKALKLQSKTEGVKFITPKSIELDDDSNATGQDFPRMPADVIENDHAGAKVKAKGDLSMKPVPRRVEIDSGIGSTFGQLSDDHALNISALRDISTKMEGRLQADLRQKNEEIASLRNQLSKMEKSMRSKHAEFEDRDFRLSLIENSNYDGSMIWKIPQFSQRMSDAQTGKYTSIFSLPFYTGRYGYKMCLRLYILGDGIGKNSHMSLFFVVMKGEFDNILPWPFTHKVTFKLVNQTGGSHITDTFQPDPMSSSFRKPKSDMNIASGCPRFVSHAELKNGGFVVDDTVFIKCAVDALTVKHP